MADLSETPVMTPEFSMSAEDAINSVKVSLADLCAKGTSNFAHKNYTEAADYFARASELQAELNGEMDPDNAEILFLYGRSLFKVGQSKSDVLGGKAGTEKKKSKDVTKSKTQNGKGTTAASTGELDTIAEEGTALVEEDNSAEIKEDAGPKKPLFQFTGDENFEDSDGEAEAEEGGGEEEEEEEDDLADAFQVLDLARVLLTRKLEQPEEGEDKGKTIGDSSMTKHLKERISDTHDLLAEISLENERFPNAVSDFKSALHYKQDLYPMESEIIAEAHYKLSLALEFASITTTKDENADDSEDALKETHVDEAMREEAAKELEAAIASTKLKLQNKEVDLASTLSVDDNDITISQISEVKDIIADMEQRLLDLRAPPIDVNAAINGPSVISAAGILGTAASESPADAQARIDEAKKTATDLSGLVRRKAKAPEPATNGASNAALATVTTTTNGKRKVDDVKEEEGLEEEEEEVSKKARVEDGVEA